MKKEKYAPYRKVATLLKIVMDTSAKLTNDASQTLLLENLLD